MKNNDDFDFIKNKFENDNIVAPDSLGENSVAEGLEGKGPAKIKLYKRRGFKAFVSAAACVAVVLCSITAFNYGSNSNPAQNDENAQGNLLSFESYSDIQKAAKRSAEKEYYDISLFDSYSYKAEATADTANESEEKGMGGGSNSETYVQVEGVDEADIIKTDSRYIYFAAGRDNTVKIYDSKTNKIVSCIDDFKIEDHKDYNYDGSYYVSYDECIYEMYLIDERLIINTTSTDSTFVKSDNTIEETHSYVYDISNVVLVRLKDKDVEFRLEIDPELSAKFHGDDQHIRQIILNLAGNAAKFTEKGHISLRLEKLEKYENRSGYRVSVIDTGVGIRQEDMGKLFDAFKQLNMSMNRTKGGTGLGLNISKNLVQLMDGSIGLESEYGKGSCFYVNLPQERVGQASCEQAYKTIFDAAPVLSEQPELKLLLVEGLLNKAEYSALFAEEAERVKFLASKANILVVDDNEVNLQIAQGLLKKLGVNAELAESGFKALELISKKDYDIIFMDHQMPVMDGIETLKRIREIENKDDGGQTPKTSRVVIALSANVSYGSRENFLAAGFNDFLGKPVQGRDFQKMLQKWLPENLIEEVEKNGEGSVPLDTVLIPKDFSEQAQKLHSYNIDVEQAVENAGDFENWFNVTKTFTRLISKNASDIEKDLINGDYKNFTILVHALKSSARIIGADKLSKSAEELEMLGKDIQAQNGNFEEILGQIQVKTGKMLSEYREFEGILASVLEEPLSSSKEKKLMTVDEFEGIKASILQACDSCDLEKIEKEMEKIKGSYLSQEVNLDIEALTDAIDQIDFEKIKTLI